MRLKRLWVDGFKNLNDFKLDFTDKEGITVLIGNNGSGKSNVLEAISAIFTGLFKMSTPQRKPKFEYEIEYILDGNDYKLALKKHGEEYRYNFHKDQIHIQTTTFKSNPSLYLPSSIIAIYSGEEMRLWEDYYKHLYNDFMRDIRGELHSLPVPKLFYINKFYWNIALLTLLYSELEENIAFCKRILKTDDLDSINVAIKFNRDNIINFQTNTITSFVDSFSDGNEEKNYTISEIKELAFIGSEKEFFLKLMASVMNKESRYKLIDSLTIIFGEHNLNIDALSEGEKKQILLRIALEVVADENSLVLMDEPDANIHVANKGKIKEMLQEYDNRENLLTTHSPTLMNNFENHLVYLENGEVKGHEKAEILKEISGDLMSFSEQQIVLNSNLDILIVEGKTDEKYIKVALDKLKTIYPEFEELEFNFLYMGGSDSENLKKLINNFRPKENQTIIAFFDNDGAGFSCIKNAFDYTMDKVDFTRTQENGIHICLYPIKDDFPTSKFEIEDYFKIETCRDFMFDNFVTFQDTKNKFKKNDFANHCNTYDVTEFEGFKKLFDLILEIKDLP